jgi:hypothetical protein
MLVAAGDIRTIKTFPAFFIGAVVSLLSLQNPSQYPILRHVNPDHHFDKFFRVHHLDFYLKAAKH